jgi:hypothetical protein
LGFPNRVLRTRFHPQRLGHFAPLSFPAGGGKIHDTRYRVVVDYYDHAIIPKGFQGRSPGLGKSRAVTLF